MEFRADKQGIVHVLCGKSSFTQEDLLQNIKAIVDAIEANRPTGAKGVYWKTGYICTTMGPSVRRLYEQGKTVNGAGINASFAVEQ